MSDNMFTEMQSALAKAEKYDVKAFEITILTGDKILRLRGNPSELERARMRQLMEIKRQQNKIDEFWEALIVSMFKGVGKC